VATLASCGTEQGEDSNMGTNYPPDGYEVGSGTWGTDMDFIAANDALSGDGYVQFAPTTPAADPFLLTEWIPTLEGSPLLVEGVAASDSNAAGDTVFIYVEWGDGDTTSLSTNSVFNGLVTTVDTWERKSAVFTAPASARYFRVGFGKNNTAFTAWWDSINITDFPKSFMAYRSSDETRGSGLQVRPDTEAYDHGSWYDTSTYTATIPESGIYQFSASVMNYADLDTNEHLLLHLQSATGVLYGYGTKTHAATDNETVSAQVSYTGAFNAGDTVRLYWEHGHATALTTHGHATVPYTYFAGFRVQ